MSYVATDVPSPIASYRYSQRSYFRFQHCIVDLVQACLLFFQILSKSFQKPRFAEGSQPRLVDGWEFKTEQLMQQKRINKSCCLQFPALSPNCGNGRVQYYIGRCEVTRCPAGCWNVRHVSTLHATYVDCIASFLVSRPLVSPPSSLRALLVRRRASHRNFSVGQLRYNLRADDLAGTVPSTFFLDITLQYDTVRCIRSASLYITTRRSSAVAEKSRVALYHTGNIGVTKNVPHMKIAISWK